jgi:hypothetical protein
MLKWLFFTVIGGEGKTINVSPWMQWTFGKEQMAPIIGDILNNYRLFIIDPS